MMVLVGCSPSSGSTLLADLLDSSDATACGPETRIFATRRLYDFASYRRDPGRGSPVASLYVPRCAVNPAALPAYGLDLEAFTGLVRAQEGVAGLAAAFARAFLERRGKPADGIVFEKTPENIHAIGDFLEAVPEGRFVHVVRSPVDVYLSLLGRGFPPFVALATWYVETVRFLPWRDHPRAFLIRYEDLVETPFETVARLLRSLGAESARADAIEEGYRTNRYRSRHQHRLPSWNVREANEVRRPLRRPLREHEVEALRALRDLRMTPGYARHFGIEAPPPAHEALRAFGYDEELAVIGGAGPGRLGPTLADRTALGRKWLGDLLVRDARVRDLAAYLRPVTVAAR